MKKLNIVFLKKIILNNIFFQIYWFTFAYTMIFFPREISVYKNYVCVTILFSLLICFIVIVYIKYTVTNKSMKNLNFIRLDYKINFLEYIYGILELINMLIIKEVFFSVNSMYVTVIKYLGCGKYNLKISNISLLVLITYSSFHLIINIIYFLKNKKNKYMFQSIYLFIIRLIYIFIILLNNNSY